MSEQTTINLATVALVQDDGSSLVINKGSDDGVSVGDRYLVYGIGREIFDPNTQESLGHLEVVRGKGVVTHVQNRIATIHSTEKMKQTVRRKIVEQPSLAFGLGGSSRRVIEEEDPRDDVELPFDRPVAGDYAKPI